MNKDEDTNINESHEDVSDSVKEPRSETQGVRTRKKSRLSSIRVRLLVVLIIVTIALTIGLWGGAPEDYKSLEEVMKNSGSYINNEVKVVGTVGNWTGGHNFTLVDINNRTVEIFVIHEKEIPDGFAESKDVVVTGKLENKSNELILRSNTQIQVGCPSKY